ncbi:hypothetical protein Daus18300_013771 [Diaporthe australafricana]|uniref:Zn(2)-C6 fungal-type domain-containing protein n=1 Tax=Diaporthe australafricana TaxID=127596 RepID=A0ABR3VXS8_9PEZI
MSLRRKSCDACFKGRRKCDRDYPTCGTCRRTNKSCRYVYAPISSASLHHDNPAAISSDSDTAEGFPANAHTPFFDLRADQPDSLPIQGPSPSSSSSSALSCAQQARPRPRLHISNFLGSLGEAQRVDGSATDSWRWVIGELRRCPRDLATRGETLFLHKHLYGDAVPRAVRAALGTSAAFCMLDEDRRQLLFCALDAEVLELLRDPPVMDADDGQGHGSMGGGIISGRGSNGLTLMDELARLQALVLYQMMRLFGGGLEQRLVVDQQRGLLTAWALQLLRRARAELDSDSNHPDSDSSWHAWIVAESIRRTVMVVYMFYGMYSLATEGVCAEIPTLAKLPVSAAPAHAAWHSEAAYVARSRSGEVQQTLTYEEYTQSWMVSQSPPERLGLFDKFLLVPCKGLEVVDSE